MGSRTIRTMVAGAAALLASVALPAVGHATTYTIDHSDAFGGLDSSTFGTITVNPIGHHGDELQVTVTITEHGFALIGGLGAAVGFTTDEAVELVHSGGSQLRGNGTIGGTHSKITDMGAGGTFGGGVSANFGLAKTFTFDILSKGHEALTVADFVPTGTNGSIFALDLVEHGGDSDHDGRWGDKGRDGWKSGVAWDDPPGATPVPGALALFAPVLGIGFVVLRRRRVHGLAVA